jgi:CHASE3 domain sensor protein
MENMTIQELVIQYEANINKIINRLKEYNNGIKIFMATIIPSYAPSYNENYKVLNEKIREIANNTADVYLLDLNA